MNNLVVIALGILFLVSASDVAIHLIGMGWFAGSLSPYTMVVDLVIVSGIAAGAASLFFPNVSWINKLLVAVLGMSLVAFIVLPLTPSSIEMPWLSATLICIYLIRSIIAIYRRPANPDSGDRKNNVEV